MKPSSSGNVDYKRRFSVSMRRSETITKESPSAERVDDTIGEATHSVSDSVENQCQQHSPVRKTERKTKEKEDATTSVSGSAENQFQQHSPVGKVGLKNFGGTTCYINSVIQALLMTNRFRNVILKYYKELGPLMSKVQTLLALLRYSDSMSFISPNDLIDYLSQPGKFHRGQQEDAAEFLRYVLNKLYDEDDKQYNIVESAFWGKTMKVSKCERCKMENSRSDGLKEVQLPLRNNNKESIQSLLNYYFEPETIGGDNKYNCNNCDRDTEHTITTIVKDAPRSLIITLNIGVLDPVSHEMIKHTDKVKVDNQVSFQKWQYEVYAIVVHSGPMMDKGHYYIFAKDNGIWYRFNDSIVTKSTLEEVHTLESTETPYIIFYKRKDIYEIVDPKMFELPLKLQSTIDKYRSECEANNPSMKSDQKKVKRRSLFSSKTNVDKTSIRDVKKIKLIEIEKENIKPSVKKASPSLHTKIKPSVSDGLDINIPKPSLKRVNDNTDKEQINAKKQKTDESHGNIQSVDLVVDCSSDKSNSCFDLPNIKISVLYGYDEKTMTAKIIEIIKSTFDKKSGIILCLNGSDCERLANALRTSDIKATACHSDMSIFQMEMRKSEWMDDRVHVIVTTVSTRLLTEKRDVRYMIHGCIPISMEAFCRESQNIGRDGETSYSYLYYSYKGVHQLKSYLTNKQKMNGNVDPTVFENINRVVSFCENSIRCRRQMLSGDEKRSVCGKEKDVEEVQCDICDQTVQCKRVNVTHTARQLGRLVRDLNKTKGGKTKKPVTIDQVIKIYKGAKIKKVLGHDEKYKFSGKGKYMPCVHIVKILVKLIAKDLLTETFSCDGEYPEFYIGVGPHFKDIFRTKIFVHKKMKPEKYKKEKKCENRIKEDEEKQQQIQERCFHELKWKRRQLAIKKTVVCEGDIVDDTAIKIMADRLPTTNDTLMEIRGDKEADHEIFGEAFLKIIRKYKNEMDELMKNNTSLAPYGILKFNRKIIKDEEAKEVKTKTNNKDKIKKNRRK